MSEALVEMAIHGHLHNKWHEYALYAAIAGIARIIVDAILP